MKSKNNSEKGNNPGPGEGAGEPPRPTTNPPPPAPPFSWWNNWLSLTGIGLAILGLGGGLFFVLMGFVLKEPPAYLSLVFIPLALVVFFGVLLLPVSGWVGKRRRHRGQPPLKSKFRVDLTSRRHLWILLGVLTGAIVTVTLLFTLSVKSFEVMESNEFCGTLCHQVMSPAWTAYHFSSHARVDCVDCHIGSGAEWFVRSKISGLRQVWAVATNSFPRPIPTPIHNLRPARETCEQCHWPAKFIGFKEGVRSYFKSDRENTPYRLRMLVKIGGEDTTVMRGSGIHYHMLLANKVEFIARDERRQDIALVRVSSKNGGNQVKEFVDSEKPLTPEQMAKLPVRTMECIDCHNRPSHKFPSPMHSVNQAIEAGLISRELPFIKLEAVRALDQDYQSVDEAMAGIRDRLTAFYKKNAAKLGKPPTPRMDAAIAEIQRIYRRTFFPDMKVKWSQYPDNIGHRDSPGCFRCHNERLQTSDGDTIFTACNKCHLILAQGADVANVRVNLNEGLPFRHPEDGEEITDYTECVDCHTGGIQTYD